MELLLLIFVLLGSGAIGMFTCCCGGCTYFTDDYSVDNLATDYTVNAGSWSVSASKLQTSSSNAQIIGNTEATDGHGHFQVTLTNSGSSDQIEIIGGYVDSNNYFYALISYGASNGTAQLYKKVAGVDTALGPDDAGVGLDASDTRTFTLCWDDEKVSIDCANTGRMSWPHVATGTKVGIGTRTIAGTITADNWLLRKTLVDATSCPECAIACSYCDSGLIPAELQVVLSGVAAQTCGGTCTSLDGTYTLSVIGSVNPYAGSPASGLCGYRYEFPSAICSHKWIEARFVNDDIEVFLINTGFGGSYGSATVTWRGTDATPIDCRNISSLSCSFVSDITAECDFSSSTATVTSL